MLPAPIFTKLKGSWFIQHGFNKPDFNLSLNTEIMFMLLLHVNGDVLPYNHFNNSQPLLAMAANGDDITFYTTLVVNCNRNYANTSDVKDSLKYPVFPACKQYQISLPVQIIIKY